MMTAVLLGLVMVPAGGDGKPAEPSAGSYVKVRVEVEIRGTLRHTDKATTVTARQRAFNHFNDRDEVKDAAGVTAYTLDFSEAKDLRELAKALDDREVVVVGKSELKMVVPPARGPGGGTGFQPQGFHYQPPTWSLQRTVLVTGLKSAK